MLTTFGSHARVFIGSIALSAALLVSPGCDKKTGETNADGTKKVKIAAVMMQQDQFFQLILVGMREAAKENNVELLDANSNNKPDKERELVSNYLTQRVDAVVITPISKDGSVAALKQAHDKGVTVITANTPISSDIAATFIECSASDLGKQTGKAAREFIEKNMGGKAKIAVLAFKSQVPEQSDARVGGFKEEVTKLPGVEIVAEQDGYLADKAIGTANDILTAHPDINIIYAANEGGTVAATLAVKNGGRAGKVYTFGTDSSEQLLGMLQSSDNILQAITSQKPVEVGRQAVLTALKVIKKEPVEKQTTLTNTLLSRTDPKGVTDFASLFKKWTSTGN